MLVVRFGLTFPTLETRCVFPVPPGESPGGTGGLPVLPMLNLRNCRELHSISSGLKGSCVISVPRGVGTTQGLPAVRAESPRGTGKLPVLPVLHGPQAFLAQVCMAPYLFSQVVYM